MAKAAPMDETSVFASTEGQEMAVEVSFIIAPKAWKTYEIIIDFKDKKEQGFMCDKKHKFCMCVCSSD